MSNSTWDLIHAERRQLLADLEHLTEDQWRTRSLCPSWNVHQMLGHVLALTKQTPPAFFGKFIAAGFRFDAMVAKDVARQSAGTPARPWQSWPRTPTTRHPLPGPVDSWIGEIVVHGADIRRPLRIVYSPPVATTRQVADFYKNSNLLIGAKKRIAGLRLIATDTDWRHGTGPEVQGPLLSLVQAITGRGVALADLAGQGTAELSTRMPAG